MKTNSEEPTWKALADGNRRRILDLLKDGPKTTGDLCEKFSQMSRFGVMKHLKVLTQAGLVIQEERGREVWNYLNAVPIRQIYDRWISGFQDQWATRLTKLKNEIEDKQ
jgi:DNA-binding transcriptional ArsR family regulator